MPASKLDAVYRSFLITKFFTKGWGKPENLKRLFEFRKIVSNRDECMKLIPRDYPVTITKEETTSDCRIIEGHFFSPLEKYLPGIVPEVAQQAHFQAILPLKWQREDYKPMCIHLAGTGDHYYWRRRNFMAKPILKDAGIGSIILENPFYGLRKPIDQVRSSLHNVSDIFVMGGCLILECLVLFHWCERNGLGPLGVTGLSMGGHMASLAATNWPKPLVLVPCLSWSTASACFTQGVMSNSINWDLLEDQYLSDGQYSEKLAKMVTIVDEAFIAGKKFALSFSQSVDVVKPVQLDNTPSPKKTQKTVVIDDTKLNGTYTDSQMSEDMHRELIDHLKANKISESLFKKLTSNEKFELDVSDIAELNSLNKETIDRLNSVANKYNLNLNFDRYGKHFKSDTPLANVTASENKCNSFVSPIAGVEEAQYKNVTNIDVKCQSDSDSDSSNEGKLSLEKVDVKKSRNLTEITMDVLASIPYLSTKSKAKKIDITKIHWRDREALQFMRGVMDEFTHLSNFTVPYDTSLIIAVCAKNDAYVPRDDVGSLEDIWPGAEVRFIDTGHVAAYVLHHSLFRSCIKEGFERSRKKWKNGRHIQ